MATAEFAKQTFRISPKPSPGPLLAQASLELEAPRTKGKNCLVKLFTAWLLLLDLQLTALGRPYEASRAHGHPWRIGDLNSRPLKQRSWHCNALLRFRLRHSHQAGMASRRPRFRERELQQRFCKPVFCGVS